MPPKLIRKHCAISAEGEKLLETAVTRLGLSARAHDRILKVARAIADLDSAADIASRHLSEAIQYRTRPHLLGLSIRRMPLLIRVGNRRPPLWVIANAICYSVVRVPK
jgi:hypothetical protein